MTGRSPSGPTLGHRFRLGVRWHPEYALGRGDEAIFEASVSACAASILERLRA